MNVGISPAVVAHRGASALHHENTLRAFEAAVEAGADVVELDVRRCVDGGLAVVHDATFEADGRGSLAISELTLAELKQLRPHTPSLDEVLEQLRGRVALEVEIKNVRGRARLRARGRDDRAATWWRRCGRTTFADAFVASFDGACLDTVKACDPEIATGLLRRRVQRDLVRARDGRRPRRVSPAGGRHARGGGSRVHRAGT